MNELPSLTHCWVTVAEPEGNFKPGILRVLIRDETFTFQDGNDRESDEERQPTDEQSAEDEDKSTERFLLPFQVV